MSRLAINYASRLACAYLLSVAAAVAIVIPLGGETLAGAQNYFTTRNIIISAVSVVVGTLVVTVGGLLDHRADAALVHSRVSKPTIVSVER